MRFPRLGKVGMGHIVYLCPMKQVLAIMQRELRHELRSRKAWLAILLYTGSTVYISYLGLQGNTDTATHNAVFWLLIIFISMFATSGSFAGRESEMFYIYTLVSPGRFVLARLLYNGVFLLSVSLLAFVCFQFFIGFGDTHLVLFLTALLLTVWGISSLLTMSFSIASKGGGGFTLMAIISFPLLVPLLITAQHLSDMSLSGADSSNYGSYIVALLALDAMIAALCYVLFPYLWRD
jgi:heme exporter protein B